MAVAFELAHPYGTTRIMSSFFFNDPSAGPPAHPNGTIISPEIADGVCTNGWVCEHRWRQIWQMNIFRLVAKSSPVVNWWDNGNNQIAFGRGSLGFIAINGDKTDLRRNLTTGLPAGRYCDIISGRVQGKHCTGKTIEVDNNGLALIDISVNAEDGVLAIHIGDTSALHL